MYKTYNKYIITFYNNSNTIIYDTITIIYNANTINFKTFTYFCCLHYGI